MSENKNTKKQKPEEKKVSEKKVSDNKATEKKKLGKKEILIIVCAAVAFVGITLGIVLGIILNKNNKFDYTKADLSKYVSLDEKYYNGYSVNINIPEITDADVERQMLTLLCENKIIPEEPVYNVFNKTISIGDVANIYYRGYTMENGVKTYFDSGCNFGDSETTALEIGSGKVVGKNYTFIPGFDTELIGKNQQNSASLTKYADGKVQLGDIISITYSLLAADGTSKRDQTVLIDLSDPKLDDRWGDGFSKYFIGKNIDKDTTIATGTKADPHLRVNTAQDSSTTAEEEVYFNIKINSACRISDGDPIIIDVTFPKDYSTEDLRGKKAQFEVYIATVKPYEVLELNDAFITDTLKVSADELAKYEGANLVEKYKKVVKEELNAARDKRIEAVIEDAFWDQAIANATFKKLPQSELDAYYNNAYRDLKDLFDSGYGSNFNYDFDAFARAYLDLSTNGDWQAEIRKEAEASVKQRLVFYYIVTEANINPNEEEYNAIYEATFAEYLQEYLDYYKITEDLADYETELENAKNAVKELYDDNYWRELVIYEYAMEKIVANANVTYS